MHLIHLGRRSHKSTNRYRRHRGISSTTYWWGEEQVAFPLYCFASFFSALWNSPQLIIRAIAKKA